MLDASRNMCRLCLHNDGKMVYLNESLTLKMSKCTSLLVLPGDGLPRKICQVCLKCLQFCDKFRKQCLASDETLRKHMKRDRVKKGKSIKRGRREGLRVPPMRTTPTDLPDQDEHIKDEQAIGIKEEDDVSVRQNEVTKVLDDCDVKEGSNVEEHNTKVKKEDDDSDYIDNLPSPEIFDDDPDYDEPLSLLKLPVDIKEEVITDNGDRKLQDKTEGPSKKKKKMILKKLDNGQKKKPKVIKVQDENGVIKKSFQCDFCGKMFRRSCQFKTHYRIHTGEKPYVCSSCPKRFTCGHQLQVHSRTHSKERPYLCRFCGKSFIDHSAVSRHHKIHTDDKKYVCDYCPKRFMTRYDLRKHTATHTGKKFYECAICSQGYTDSSAFAKHKKSHQVTQPSS